MWNGNLSAFQIKIGCRSVFTDDDRRDSGRKEVLEIIEGYQTGCFILCDVVERMTRINTVVQGDTGQTVHLVLCSRARLVGWERVVLKTRDNIIVADSSIIAVVYHSVCRNNHDPWLTCRVVGIIPQVNRWQIIVVDAPYQHSVTRSLLVPSLVSDVLQQQVFALAVGYNLVCIRCLVVWFQLYLLRLGIRKEGRLFPSYDALLPW